MRTLSQREQRLIALLILAMAIGAIWGLLIAPILSGFSDRSAQRSALLLEYQANQRLIGSIPRLRRQAERQRDDFRSIVLTAPNAATASIAIQERLQQTIESVGGEVRGVEDAATTDQQVRMRASARMTLAQITPLLTRLQNEPPSLIVETLNISADQAVISGRLDIMEVSFEVSVPLILAKPR